MICLKVIACCSEPVIFNGEGEYNLNVLKEIDVTDAYLGLDQGVRGCQTKESLNNCTTRHYIENLLNKCNCLPFALTLFQKVHIVIY